MIPRMFLLTLALCSSVLAQATLDELEETALYAAASEVSASVLRIETIGGLERVGDLVPNAGPTSGVVVGDDGYVVSSAFNFIQDPTSILVQLPSGQRKSATIVSRDHGRKLVLLKVATDEALQVPAVAPKAELRSGQWTVTVGRTLPGEGFNLSSGIVSAVDRIWGRAVQTDANVSPANYGGALADVHGRVIGVLVPMSPESNEVIAGAEWYDSGIGFAIPLEDVLASLEQFKSGDLYPGVMGIVLKGNDLYGAEAVVAVTRPNSPARDAGLQVGDKIVAVDDVATRRQADLKQALGPRLAEETLELKVEREGSELAIELTLTDKLIPYEHAFLGILPTRAAADSDVGVQVRHVFADSPAAAGGFSAGDVINRVAGMPVDTADGLREALAEFEPGDALLLGRLRGDVEDELNVKLSTLPDGIPAELPDAYPTLEDGEQELPQLGKVNIKLPEEEGECEAYVPVTYDPRFEHALLVLLPVPGKEQAADLITQWRDHCDASRTILLMPQAKETRSWLPTETAFIRKTIENLKTAYRVDPERIAVLGVDNSGSMAFLVAFTHRDLFRGVAAIRAPVPRRAPTIYNEPLQRLAIYVGLPADSPLGKRVAANEKMLREAKLPVTRINVTESGDLSSPQKEELLRWIDSLDRI